MGILSLRFLVSLTHPPKRSNLYVSQIHDALRLCTDCADARCFSSLWATGSTSETEPISPLRNNYSNNEEASNHASEQLKSNPPSLHLHRDRDPGWQYLYGHDRWTGSVRTSRWIG